MENSVGSKSINKPWDHAWSTEEMRKNRRDWSLAGDSGLLKHLQQFSENLVTKANETHEAIISITSQLDETAIIVDNITNTSLALANTQFIESRVQEDNIETELPEEKIIKNEDDNEFCATDLLISVSESIKKGLIIMEEKYEKVEVLAIDSEDEGDRTVPSMILKPKDPYQDRPLPYVIGTEQWKASNKVGLECSSSESEQNDEDEDSASDTNNKNMQKIISSQTQTHSGTGRLSSASSESNDYHIQSSTKDTINSRLHARSQDTLNSDTEPNTPSNILPKVQNVNTGLPSFAEELAKRLGNVMPPQNSAVTHNSKEQIVNHSEDDLFTPEGDKDIFSNKSDNKFSEGKNLFSDEVPSSSSWKNKPVRPVNKNIIPPSIDVPPPLSIISSAPKSTIDDLFGDADESEDSDDIFTKKCIKDIFADEREAIRSDVNSKQKNPQIESVQNTSTMATSTPETNDKEKGLFDDEEDDLFGSTSKQIKTFDEPSLESITKKPVGGVSIFGKVDVLSSSKFGRRPSSSSSDSDSSDRRSIERVSSNNSENATAQSVGSGTTSKSNSSSGANVSSLEAGNNVSNFTPSTGSNTGSSSGISLRQPSSDYTAGSSLGADFQPLMSSSRLKSEEIYRERVSSDSLFASRSGANESHQDRNQPQTLGEDVSEHEDVFGPPPLPKLPESVKTKSKVISLFDDSDSGDDLFASTSASPSSRSFRSSEPTPSRAQVPRSRGLFDDDNDDELFGTKEAPDVDLFAAVPVRSLSKAAAGLFDDVDEADDDAGANLFAPSPEKGSLFGDRAKIAEVQKKEDDKSPKQSLSQLSKEPEKVEKKRNSRDLFEDVEELPKSDLIAGTSKIPPIAEKSSFRSIFEDTEDLDLFGPSSKNVLGKKAIDNAPSLFSDSDEIADLFGNKAPKKKESFEDLSEGKATRTKNLATSIFDDSDEDDLFSGSSMPKSASSDKSSSIFEEKKSISIAKNMEVKKQEAVEVLLAAKEDKNANVKKPDKVETKAKPAEKSKEKSSIFDDDDDDDLFGDKKKKIAIAEKMKTSKKESKENSSKTKAITAPETKPDLAAKKAIFAEIKQKLEKHKADMNTSVTDGAVSSKREPPNSLKIKATQPPDEEASGGDQKALKKPVVSGKIANLMGKMGNLKILSPTDTPPLLRKEKEEKPGDEEEQVPAAAECDSSEDSSPSLPSGDSSPQTSGTNSRARDSPSLRSENTEVAISFEEPAQVETLTSIASKSRARIPAKRRPQSRQARQTALRHSGIDFDIVDASTLVSEHANGEVQTTGATDQLQSRKSLDAGHGDDRSELSASRNTTTNLLSPSTDEEDLFDVPPDLPEDPSAKEDSLFGRAPILSPIEDKIKVTKKASTAIRTEELRSRAEHLQNSEIKEEKSEPIDPLRDESHDPLKDPSQLFAFVTKTPSPEKDKGLLFNDDDNSLFSNSKKSSEKLSDDKSKPSLNLFVDNDDMSSNDLFSSKSEKLKKSLKDTKISLFDETVADDENSLFGSTTKKSEQIANSNNSPSTSRVAAKRNEKVDSKSTKASSKDIFDNSSEDDDLFSSSKKVVRKKKSKSLFDDEEEYADSDDIFAKPQSSTKYILQTPDNDKSTVKNTVTRDLKKTAEKIVEDPLSMLQND